MTSCHCGACHESFTGLGGFEKHRKNNSCLKPAEMRSKRGEVVLVPANKDWPGWSEPGTWDGPDAA